MTAANPSILSHISLGTAQFDAAVAFYDQVLATLGCKRILEHPGAVAWGREYPEFWIQAPIDGAPASVGNGSHARSMANPITAASCATSTATRSRRPTGTRR